MEKKIIIYEFIKEYDRLCREYVNTFCTSESVVNIYEHMRIKRERKGLFLFNNREVKFKIHGSSMEFESEDGLILSFCFSPKIETHFNFTSFDIYLFISTYTLMNGTITENDCNETILKLEKMGMIEKSIKKHTQVPQYYGIYVLVDSWSEL